MTSRATLSSSSINSDITLLLLGETGVGKSTWINGFANFVEYDTLDVAEEAPSLCLIPASFTMTDENYDERVVSVGQDENEVTSVGQSATQGPQTYTFTKDGHVIRLIDTPGIGDVRGVEQDKKNFQQILNHIAHLDVLHGICILLKPNNARLNVMFSFCIKELLANLHRDACRNIVFCFTNSRSTFYRPGDTLPALKKLLSENPDVQIPLNQKTLYCMDNESIRFLYAIKDGIAFTSDERQNYGISWDKSVSEVNRLLTHVASQTPHDVQNTLSLNNARQTVLALSEPLVTITENIQKNLVLAEDKKLELQTSTRSKEELAKTLQIPKIEVLKEFLEEPRTVCTNVSCVNLVSVGTSGGATIYGTEYTTSCHSNCSRGKKKSSEVLQMVGHKTLQKCSAFDRKGNCKSCGCSWTWHMKTMEVSKVEVIQVSDPETEELIQQKQTAIEKLEVFLESVDKTLAELHEEQREITNASAKFACFLKNNAIRPYNDSIIAYITHCINHEKNVQRDGGEGGGVVVQRLEHMREIYEKEIKLLEAAITKGNDKPVSPEELKICVERLCKLKHNGKVFKNYMTSKVAAEAATYTEKRVEIKGHIQMTTTTKKKSKKLGFSGILSAFNTKPKQYNTIKNRPKTIGPVLNPRPDIYKHGNVPKSTPPARPPQPNFGPTYRPLNAPKMNTPSPAFLSSSQKFMELQVVPKTEQMAERHQRPGPAVHNFREREVRWAPQPPSKIPQQLQKVPPLPPRKTEDVPSVFQHGSKNEKVNEGDKPPRYPPPPPPPPSCLPEGPEPSHVQTKGGETREIGDLLAQIRRGTTLKAVKQPSGRKSAGGNLENAIKGAILKRGLAFNDQSVDEDEEWS